MKRLAFVILATLATLAIAVAFCGYWWHYFSGAVCYLIALAYYIESKEESK